MSRKLRKTPDVLKEYNEVIRQQLESGVIEKVTGPGEAGAVTYLPHQAVIRDQKVTTKLRVVLDASAKGQWGIRGTFRQNDFLGLPPIFMYS